MKSLFALFALSLLSAGCERDSVNRGTDNNTNRNAPVNPGGDGSRTPNQGQPPR